MHVNAQNIRAVSTALSTAFNVRLASTTTLYGRIAMTVPSTTSANEYPRLDDLPGLREWVGDRVFHDLSAGSYTIRNRKFEGSFSVLRDKIEDDQIGLYTPAAQQLGQSAAEFPDILSFNLLKQGDTTRGLDGQNFFDTDHPGFDDKGKEVSVSNYQAGAGPAWFLVDDTRVLKPLVYQTRRPFTLTSLDSLTDENVFKQDKFLYGVDGRCNVGFSMWQLAFMSKAPLTAENYAAARAAMGSIRRPNGSVIAITPRLLLVPSALESAARMLINGDLVPTTVGGATVAASNPWKGTAEILVVPHLA